MLTLTMADQAQIRSLLASAPNRITTMADLVAAALAMREGHPLPARAPDSIMLQDQFMVVYDLMKTGARMMEQLSISKKGGVASEQDIMVLATAFGLGDRATWALFVPAKPPAIKAAHIQRMIA